MYGFCRLGFSPRAVQRRSLGYERRCEHDDGEREEDGDAPEHRNDPGDDVAGAAAVQQHRCGSVAGEDEQPQEQRSLLAAPERGDLVARRQLAARVGPHVDEREVVPHEGDEQHERRDDRAAESRDQRVLRRHARAAAAPPAAYAPATTAYSASPRVTTSAARPSSGILRLRARFARCVLGRALRDHAAGVADENAVPQRAFQADIAVELELVRDGAPVQNGDRRR